MSGIKWAWIFFIAATILVAVRLATTTLRAPADEHAQRVETATQVAAAPAEAVPAEEKTARQAEAAREESPVAADAPGAYEEPEQAPEPERSAEAAETTRAEEHDEPFHFRRIRWGMTPEEVRAAETEAILGETAGGLRFATTTLGMPCLLDYGFAHGRLVRARLSFSDPAGRDIPPLTVAQAQRRFLRLREELRARYGDAVQKSVRAPRDVTGLSRSALRQEELAKQYDAEIAEAEERLRKQREWLQKRYERWPNRESLVERELRPRERDLRELREWKKEALANAMEARKAIQNNRAADATSPLVALVSARWSAAKELHDVELVLDLRGRVPLLEVRYEWAQLLPTTWGVDEL